MRRIRSGRSEVYTEQVGKPLVLFDVREDRKDEVIPNRIASVEIMLEQLGSAVGGP